MKEKEDKEITIAELAGMVADGFSRMESKFVSIDQRFDRLEKKVETEISSLRFEMRAEFRNVEKRIDGLEYKIDQMDKASIEEVLILSSDLIELKSRVQKLEQKIAKLKLANS